MDDEGQIHTRPTVALVALVAAAFAAAPWDFER